MTALKTKEGLILIFASLAYLAIGISAAIFPSISAVFGFIGLIAFFVPVILILFFLKIGGYRNDFRSDWFNTAVMLTVALIPLGIVAKSALLK